MSAARSLLPAPWLPGVPRGWSTARLGRLVKFHNGRDFKADEVVEGGYPVYGSGGEFARTSRFLHKGPSVLFGRKGTLDRPLLVTEPFWTVDTMFFTEITERVDVRYIHYVATTIPFVRYKTNTAVPSMTSGDLEAHVVAFPDKALQVEVADYLDRETAKIDTLIAKQEQLIATLRERRSALAVWELLGNHTPGQTRTTGIAWLTGKTLPAHWSETRVKHLVDSMAAGDAITAQTIDIEGSYPVYGGNGLRGYAANWNREGTSILIGRQGALCGNIHIVGGRYWASEHAIVARAAAGVDTRWLAEMLRIMNLGQYSQTAAQPGIGTSNILPLEIPLPPYVEQRSIADRIDVETTKIDTLIAKAERFIELSKQRRAALITAAVTGQIEVPTTK